MTTLTRRKNAGVTLMELLVVLVILGVLGTFVAPRFFNQPEKARRTTAELQIKKIAEALEMYKLDNRRYPTTEQGLKALVEKPSSGPAADNWQQGGYMASLPRDPWGNDYVYLHPGVHGEFDIISYGADGKKGGTGENADITNWK
jgi:general secretion pathway protein G